MSESIETSKVFFEAWNNAIKDEIFKDVERKSNEIKRLKFDKEMLIKSRDRWMNYGLYALGILSSAIITICIILAFYEVYIGDVCLSCWGKP